MSPLYKAAPAVLQSHSYLQGLHAAAPSPKILRQFDQHGEARHECTVHPQVDNFSHSTNFFHQKLCNFKDYSYLCPNFATKAAGGSA